MKLLSQFFIALTLTISFVQGNPIAVDPNRRNITMVCEDVTVTVQSGNSQVCGKFTFEMDKDDWPKDPDTHVFVFIPVLLPVLGTPKTETVPVLKLGNRRFKGVIRNDITVAGTPRFVCGLPKDWFLCVYEVSLPFHMLKKLFTIDVSYMQPHFPRDICGYVPVHPPKTFGASRIRFVADTGFALKKLGWSLFRNQGAEIMDFIPKDRHLISVRCIKSDIGETPR